MKTFIKNFIYDKKDLFLISFIQFLYGISELFFSLTAGLSISSFIVNKKVVVFNLEFTNFAVFILLILSIILRTFFSYLASKCSSASVYKLWNLIIEKAFFVIRNGHININQIGSFISLIQLESYVGLNSFYYTFYQILGDLLLIFFGVIFLAVTNSSATIYTFIIIILFIIIVIFY